MLTAIDNARAPGIDLGRIALEADAVRRIPKTLAYEHDILALSTEGNELTIAIADRADREAIDRVRLATGMHVRSLYAPREKIRSRLSEAYGEHAGVLGAEESPAVRALDEIHAGALRADASDIHIEPTSHGGRVRARIDGLLYEVRALPAELYGQLVSRVKLLAGMDIADRRQPQDGRYAIELDGRSVDARVNSMPTIAGEKLAIRLLESNANIPGLESLGMAERELDAFRRAVHAPHGFVVVCGPTGSGKTTTLYAAMSERNVPAQNLCSVEDPVEARIPGVAQVQINSRAGVTFGSALRSLLRQDPNVIMIGEMRDEETAAIAGSASLSGQLVLATLHANDVPGSLARLLELGMHRSTAAAGLTCLAAQRLLRTLCPVCKNGEGCERCNYTGFAGRTAIFECLFLDEAMRGAIAAGASGAELAELGRARGYRPMSVQAMRLVDAGKTTMEELQRVLPMEERA